MSKGSKKKASNKRLEALLHAQKIAEMVKVGGIQGQALLDSAGENMPNDETHVVDLLESGTFAQTETAPSRRASKSQRKKANARPRPKQKQKAKKKKRR